MKQRNKKGQFVKGVRPSIDTEFKKGQHWRKPKPHWNKEWLFNEYITKQNTSSEIGKMVGCTDNNILFWLKKHGIKTRSISETRAIKYWGSPGEENGMYGRTGDKNGNWRGGISPQRQAYYSSIEWSKSCRGVWGRDNGKCRRCGRMKKNSKASFHIHHIVSFEVITLRSEISNLVLLCAKCHHFVHSKANIKRQFLREKTFEL